MTGTIWAYWCEGPDLHRVYYIDLRRQSGFLRSPACLTMEILLK